MSGQGIPRSVFERALKRALVTLAVQEGVLPTAQDASANHELYQRLCVFIDLGLETEGIVMKPRPVEFEEKDATNVVRLH